MSCVAGAEEGADPRPEVLEDFELKSAQRREFDRVIGDRTIPPTDAPEVQKDPPLGRSQHANIEVRQVLRGVDLEGRGPIGHNFLRRSFRTPAAAVNRAVVETHVHNLFRPISERFRSEKERNRSQVSGAHSGRIGYRGRITGTYTPSSAWKLAPGFGGRFRAPSGLGRGSVTSVLSIPVRYLEWGPDGGSRPHGPPPAACSYLAATYACAAGPRSSDPSRSVLHFSTNRAGPPLSALADMDFPAQQHERLPRPYARPGIGFPVAPAAAEPVRNPGGRHHTASGSGSLVRGPRRRSARCTAVTPIFTKVSRSRSAGSS